MTDWNVSFNGLTVGPGTPFGVTALDGWLDLQGVTTVDTAKPNADGSWTSPDYNPGRLVNLFVDIAGATSLFPDAVHALEAATVNQAAVTPVVLQIPGRPAETILAKVRKRTIPTDFQYQMGLTHAAIQFWAPDPRRFGWPVTVSAPLPSAVGGFVWPVAWPVAWIPASVTGQISLGNPGTTTGPLVVRIDGPVTAPSVTQVGTGRTVAFGSGLVLARHEFLLIDMDARTALDQGQSSRAAYITQRGWFGLTPGNNLIAWNSETFDRRALMTVTAKPAWK